MGLAFSASFCNVVAVAEADFGGSTRGDAFTDVGVRADDVSLSSTSIRGIVLFGLLAFLRAAAAALEAIVGDQDILVPSGRRLQYIVSGKGGDGGKEGDS